MSEISVILLEYWYLVLVLMLLIFMLGMYTQSRLSLKKQIKEGLHNDTDSKGFYVKRRISPNDKEFINFNSQTG